MIQPIKNFEVISCTIVSNLDCNSNFQVIMSPEYSHSTNLLWSRFLVPGTFTHINFELITYNSETNLPTFSKAVHLKLWSMYTTYVRINWRYLLKKKNTGYSPQECILWGTLFYMIYFLSLQLIPSLPNHSSMFLECD